MRNSQWLETEVAIQIGYENCDNFYIIFINFVLYTVPIKNYFFIFTVGIRNIVLPESSVDL
jgi:hypothetical protein